MPIPVHGKDCDKVSNQLTLSSSKRMHPSVPDLIPPALDKQRIFSDLRQKEWSRRSEAQEGFDGPLLALKMRRASWQRIRMASRNSEQSPADSSKGPGTSVLWLQDLNSAPKSAEPPAQPLPCPHCTLRDPEQRTSQHLAGLLSTELWGHKCMLF